jgi:hypothetical protein
LRDLNIKSSLVVLFSVALLTGFISVANTKPIFASPLGGIDLGDLTGQPWSGGGNGPAGTPGEPWSGGDDGPDRDRGDRGDDGPDRDRGDEGDNGPDSDRGDEGDNGPDSDRDNSGTTGEPIGFLNIKKNVVGGDRPASNFMLNIEGNNPSKTVVDGSAVGVDVIVGEGDYRVTEQPITGYTTTYSEGCEGDISMNSQREFCVVTNTATTTATAKGTLRVSVQTIEQGCPFLDCPSPSPSDFEITVTGYGGQLYSFMGSKTVMMDPGTYTVDQQAPSGSWNVDFSEGCEDTISAGQLKTCIITNRGYTDP